MRRRKKPGIGRYPMGPTITLKKLSESIHPVAKVKPREDQSSDNLTLLWTQSENQYGFLTAERKKIA